MLKNWSRTIAEEKVKSKKFQLEVKRRGGFPRITPLKGAGFSADRRFVERPRRGPLNSNDLDLMTRVTLKLRLFAGEPFDREGVARAR